MTDKRKNKILERSQLHKADRVELVSALVLILNGFEQPDVLRDIYRSSGIDSIELVSAIIAKIGAGDGTWRITPPTRKSLPCPVFTINKSCTPDPGEKPWIEVLRIGELFLSTMVEAPLEPEKIELGQPCLSLSPSYVVMHEDTLSGDPLVDEVYDVVGYADDGPQNGDQLFTYESGGADIGPTILRAVNKDGSTHGLDHASGMLSQIGISSMPGPIDTDSGRSLVTTFGRLRNFLPGIRRVDLGDVYGRIERLSLTDQSSVCRISRRYYGSNAIDWGGSYLQIGGSRYFLPDRGTFMCHS
jgi:hypothetical protein